jgi:hypothetical protein
MLGFLKIFIRIPRIIKFIVAGVVILLTLYVFGLLPQPIAGVIDGIISVIGGSPP